jgi:uncharacterized protein (DUF433 family)
MANLNWSECAAIETVPGKMSGQPVIKGTRVRPVDLLVNREQGVPWLVENFGIPAVTVREIFDFADRHKRARAPAVG